MSRRLVRYRVVLDIVQPEHENVPESWDWTGLLAHRVGVGHVEVVRSSRHDVDDVQEEGDDA